MKKISFILGIFLLFGMGCDNAELVRGVVSNEYSKFDGHYVLVADDAAAATPQSIDVEWQEGAALRVQGKAFWRGAASDNIHTGFFRGTALVNGMRATYKNDLGDEGCIVFIDFLDENKLSVKDNFRCGGMNVTFMGAYEKKNGIMSDWSGFEDG